MNKSSRFVPMLIAIGMVVGIFIGNFFAKHFSNGYLSLTGASSNKINDLFHLIDDQYVDSIDLSDLVEKSLPKILMELDPHSVYISAKDVESSMQDLRGSFSGIGVQFSIIQDTVCVVKVVPGGPSDDSGLLSGDKIVAVDGKPYVGKDVVNNEETMKRLKGEKGSRVKLSVLHYGDKKPTDYTIVRGDVPLHSVDAVFMADETTGFIRINNFGETTYPEFLSALASLSSENFQGLIIDLRGNVGGYMEPAVQIANEFLSKGSLIVYTQGRKSPREEYVADGRGTYQTLPLTVLVDETSASASEILSGALQDNDRATIIGRRTFGKGLVQIPIEFKDGSMLRLTKARYYTPSGRCVQKPYTPGNEAKYEEDLLLRAETGEYFSSDSIKTSGEKYYTRIGRVVYGGGGIIPDVFISRDTLDITSYYRDAVLNGYVNDFCFVFTNRFRKEMQKYTEPEELKKWLDKQPVLEYFAQYAEGRGLHRRNLMLQRSSKLFLRYIYANVFNQMMDENAAAKIAAIDDPAIIQALQLMREKKTFPQKVAQVFAPKAYSRIGFSNMLARKSQPMRHALAVDFGALNEKRSRRF